MVSLTSSLYSAGEALQAYEQALAVSENNITNSSTPGYARQVASFDPLPFDLSTSEPGGVLAGPAQDTRDTYVETNVQQKQSSTNYYGQQVTDLSTLQSMFDLSSTSGISGALNQLFQSFSQLSVDPNDTVTRQNVLNQAATTAQAFNQAAQTLGTTAASINSEAQSTINQINALAQQIATVNNATSGDAGTEAQLYNDLENLSQLVNFTTVQQQDGSLTVYLGGQTPIVTGDQAQTIQGDFSTPEIAITDSTGRDITSEIAGGQLGALIQEQNTTLPGYGNSLNTLASTLADQVNQTLGAGVDQNGASPSEDLFAYNVSAGAAASLSVNALTPDQIAAALPTSPGGNGNALALAALANSQVVNGYTFTTAFGNLGQTIGNDISNAQSNQTTQSDLLTQAENLRSQTSGVDLNQEAVIITQFEQAYNANARMLGIVSQLTETLMDIFQPQVTS